MLATCIGSLLPDVGGVPNPAQNDQVNEGRTRQLLTALGLAMLVVTFRGATIFWVFDCTVYALL